MTGLLVRASTIAVCWGLATAALAQQPGPAPSAPAPAPPQNEPSEVEVEEVIVTGVLSRTAARDAAVAVSVLTTEEIQEQVPVSSADLLKSVPGVYVNSALGEIRNIVYSRGVSANSVEAASGYYYVSLQEDGLPVTNVTFVNYGPDYFSRPDILLGRLEALRGGTAVVTGPNAPGGIFNYISRSGEAETAYEVRARVGLEGDGDNPYYRADALASGEVGDSGVYYSIGGFYRRSRGARDAGYDLNRGGQIRGNLTWDYGDGELQVFAKYLDDHNGFYEFLPARNFSDPKLIDGFSNGDSFLPPAAEHTFIPYAGQGTRSWDGERLAHAKSAALQLRVDHDFGQGWSLVNNFKLSRNEMEWNTGGVIFPIPITDIVLNVFLNQFAVPGTVTYRERGTGRVVAEVVRTPTNPFGTVTVNNLPNQQVLQNGVLSQAALYYEPVVDEIMDQIALTKEFDRATVTLGGFYARSEVDTITQGAGLGVSPIQSQPQLFDITYTTPSGVVQQLTDPAGFAGIGQRLGPTRSQIEQTQMSAFLGVNLDITDRFTVDGGVRYEKIDVEGANQIAGPNPSPMVGGLDGNVNTLYDNFVVGLSAPFQFDRSLDFITYSGALNYQWNDTHNTYIRYSKGEKAPDLAFYQGLDSNAELTGSPSVTQEVKQLELGHRIDADRFTLVISPFYSELSRVGNTQLFTRADGSFYGPPPLFAVLETLGVEIEGDIELTGSLTLQTGITLQDPKSKEFAVYVANTPGEADDTILRVPDGDADNSPKVTTNTTLRYAPSERYEGYITHRYLGDRAANRYNTFYLPGFHQVDIGGTLNLTEQFSLSANVNNLFNEEGVMSWGPAGGLLASLDRQAFTPASRAANPDQPFNVILVQPRAFFLSATLRY